MRNVFLRATFMTIGVILFFSVVFTMVSLWERKADFRREIGYHLRVDQVEQYRPLVEIHAKEHGLEQEVDTLLAIMMQESGGRGDDPMQASESLCGERGCIDHPEQSIAQGIAYFKEVFDKADGDRKLAIQSYNYGVGFVSYALEKAGQYTFDVAVQFSQEMYEKAEDKSLYTCIRKEAREYDACYGDILYVRDVLGYRDLFLSHEKQDVAKVDSQSIK